MSACMSYRIVRISGYARRDHDLEASGILSVVLFGVQISVRNDSHERCASKTRLMFQIRS